MDVEEFTRKVKPRKNGSQLLRFQNEIGDLKRQGYSDEQIREWLANNSITVSRENVRKFIKRHLPDLSRKFQVEPQVNLATPIVNNQATEKILVEEITGSEELRESQADRIRKLAEEQRNEAEKSRFKHDRNGNNH
jgi:hypothetical protein